MNKVLEAITLQVSDERYIPRQRLTSLVSCTEEILPTQYSHMVDVKIGVTLGQITRIEEIHIERARQQSIEAIRNQLYGDILYELCALRHLVYDIKDGNLRERIEDRIVYIEELME